MDLAKDRSKGDDEERNESTADEDLDELSTKNNELKKDKSTNDLEKESSNDSKNQSTNDSTNENMPPDEAQIVQLTEEEIKLRIEKSTQLKDEGNLHFKNEQYDRSIELYDEALTELRDCTELKEKKSIILNNKAVCKWKLLERSNPNLKDDLVKNEFEEIIKLLTESIELNPTYIKPYLKRAELNHKFGDEKLDSSLDDYKKVLEFVPNDNRKLVNEIKHEICKLESEIQVRNEKLKDEMLSKLKDLGNLCLRPFGLSTDNFKLQQNESGGYSINFQQQ